MLSKIRLKCVHCGGIKFVGDPYYANGIYYVDVTCIVCSETKDIEVDRLKKFLAALERGGQNDIKKADSE